MNTKQLKYYDELSPAAQTAARFNVMIPELEANTRRLATARQVWRADIHKAINDAHHVRRLMNGAQALYKARRMGNEYVIPYIRSNRTIFTECGAYVYYIKSFTVIKNGVEYPLTEEESAPLRDAYIAVNERGPDYHDRLHRELNAQKRKAK